MEDFLLRLVADGARVVKDQCCFLNGLDLAISLMHQCADDLLRIMHIHLAAKGFQIKRLFLLCAHSSSISQQNSGDSGYS